MIKCKWKFGKFGTNGNIQKSSKKPAKQTAYMNKTVNLFIGFTGDKQRIFISENMENRETDRLINLYKTFNMRQTP